MKEKVGKKTDISQTEIRGHIHVFEDKIGIFKPKLEKPNKTNSKSRQNLNEGASNFNDITIKSDHYPPKGNKTHEFADMVLMYPVGRHVALRSLETH